MRKLLPRFVLVSLFLFCFFFFFCSELSYSQTVKDALTKKANEALDIVKVVAGILGSIFLIFFGVKAANKFMSGDQDAWKYVVGAIVGLVILSIALSGVLDSAFK